MKLVVVIVLIIGLAISESLQDIESCPSPIFCQGQLLHTVQMARIFNDSKTFVDHSLKNSVNETLIAFDKFMKDHNNKPSKDEIIKFVDEYFDAKGEIESWTPPDYNENPKFLERIKNPDVKKFAKNLISIWPKLGMKVKKGVFDDPDKHSLISLPNGFIVPGGRFKEIYYWDSYWIIEGLILSEMTTTVKGMLENLLSLVDRFGFVPNGSRVYYLNRSQPPLLALMVARYIEETEDLEFAKKQIGTLEKELNFWLAKRTINVTKNGATYKLIRYAVESNTPRPESYSEDVKTCSVFSDDEKKKYCYSQLKSGAESGMDFSSRWIADKTHSFNLSHIDLYNVVPVDLNAFFYKAVSIVSDLYELLGDDKKSKQWLKTAEEWKTAIKAVFYNVDDGIWYDYDLKNHTQIKDFYPNNVAPLWADAYDTTYREIYGKKATEYLQKLKISNYKGGIPTSLNRVGEQWDMPNAWAPLQELVILGLFKSNSTAAMNLAHELATNWVKANMIGYKKTGVMFEKYDAEKPGQYGGGGEYTVQSGFGWTNGAALQLIDIFDIE